MAVWLVRAGKAGEHEAKFLAEKRIYLAWSGLNKDLTGLQTPKSLRAAMAEVYPDRKSRTLQSWASQIFPFAHSMESGDLVVLPRKTQSTIAIGTIEGVYTYLPKGPDPYFHSRKVRWLNEGVPRAHFGQDLLYSFGAFMTICRIQRNNAEARLRAMAANKWAREKAADVTAPDLASDSDPGSEAETVDLEQLGEDQIAKLIEARFSGHKLSRLVEAILRAKGYSTWLAPEGADGGADILAGDGALGFGSPRLCVQVKSEPATISRSVVDNLLGAMSKFGADQGLFVAWGGYKSNVQRELAQSYFKVRLWSGRDLMAELFAEYDKLDEDIRVELPLKRVWTVTLEDGE